MDDHISLFLIISQDKRLSKLHAASLGRQQELLLDKIEMFDYTNHSLRELLREWSEQEVREVYSVEENSMLTCNNSLLTVVYMLCCCIDRENHWCGQNRKMP